jgi:WD repeat-containing protein 48
MKKLPNTMTLATLRAHVWKGGADVMLYYKSNGRKPIKYEKKVAAIESSTLSTSTTQASKESAAAGTSA